MIAKYFSQIYPSTFESETIDLLIQLPINTNSSLILTLCFPNSQNSYHFALIIRNPELKRLTPRKFKPLTLLQWLATLLLSSLLKSVTSIMISLTTVPLSLYNSNGTKLLLTLGPLFKDDVPKVITEMLKTKCLSLLF